MTVTSGLLGFLQASSFTEVHSLCTGLVLFVGECSGEFWFVLVLSWQLCQPELVA